MRRASLLVVAALASVSRADEPVSAPVLTCDGTGCGGVSYEALFGRGTERAPIWRSNDAADRWTPLATDGAFTLAWRQPVEDDRGADGAAWRDALARLALDGDGLRQDVEPDAASAQMSAGSLAGAASPLSSTGPDDREFLDVVLVGSTQSFHCTGVLVAPSAVLTAAHCAPAARVGFGHRATRLLATVAISDAIAHPQFDVALLRLARPVPLPIRPRRTAADRGAPAAMVRLVGFGVDDLRHPTSFGVKRRADVLASGWGCDRGRARTARCQPGAELLLTAVGGADTCRGDSGGPVLESTSAGYRLLAITSRSTASGGAACGRGGIYVRADVIDRWLTTLLEQSP